MTHVTFLADLCNMRLQSQVCICGKILKIRKMGGISFVILFDQTAQCQVVIEKTKDIGFQKGDFLQIEGIVRKWEDKVEVCAERWQVLGTSNLRVSPRELKYKKIQKLILKSKVIQIVNRFMEENGFLPVSSPTIVGNWVEGKTNSFAVEYFGTQKYLTLNSMLYHQVMMISGYNRIYEFSKIFRQDASSPKDRLAEFVSLDISMSPGDKDEMMNLVEDLIRRILSELPVDKLMTRSGDGRLPRISYTELVEVSGCRQPFGAQLPAKARNYLNKQYQGFVWIYGFPEEKRRFFVRSVDGFCYDYQLWFRGKHQVASGGERETDLVVMKKKIQDEGKEVANYDDFLKSFENGVPPMCEIGFGFDRFLLDITEGEEISDFVAFPRNGNTDF